MCLLLVQFVFVYGRIIGTTIHGRPNSDNYSLSSHAVVQLRAFFIFFTACTRCISNSEFAINMHFSHKNIRDFLYFSVLWNSTVPNYKPRITNIDTGCWGSQKRNQHVQAVHLKTLTKDISSSQVTMYNSSLLQVRHSLQWRAYVM